MSGVINKGIQSRDLGAGGSTPSEMYLATLCQKAFLSLWAYPNVYTDEGRANGRGAGQELCDLLVVFGNEIIIFSDKHCQYKETGDDSVDWKRWYRRAIKKSVKQLVGATSFIKKFPDRLYRDRDCSIPFPRQITGVKEFNFHLIAVTRGAREACERYFSGKSIGSFRLLTDLDSDEVPFAIGPIKTEYGFVHVFDEHTLDVLFSELDTAADFVRYLSKRATLLQRPVPILMVDGEEQLLARYLKNMVDTEHDFAIDTEIDGEMASLVYVQEGEWESFVQNGQYLAKKEADKISYHWDALIEGFAQRGQPHLVPVPEFIIADEPEPAIREMASESRFDRRILSETLVNFAQAITPGMPRVRVGVSPSTKEKAYVFLAEPFISSHFSSYDEYRKIRVAKLAAYATVARVRFPLAKSVVGIAFDGPSQDKHGGSEDLYCHYVPEVTSEVLDDARGVQKEFGLLLENNIFEKRYSVSEYPANSILGARSLSRQQRRAMARSQAKAYRRK